ncbi:hypothetical protein KIPB_007060 [Kipferlia bialata]|uniref:Uncharacterized protein n=1 Tax=Kipferlia bialata TaxID=797122 RepID=A0A9K3CY07_9EUKA|nr:hypothetical protein KIPB_007060 [Kipferlia bialata]|eukprot:g7060.t1
MFIATVHLGGEFCLWDVRERGTDSIDTPVVCARVEREGEGEGDEALEGSRSVDSLRSYVPLGSVCQVPGEPCKFYLGI